MHFKYNSIRIFSLIFVIISLYGTVVVNASDSALDSCEKNKTINQVYASKTQMIRQQQMRKRLEFLNKTIKNKKDTTNGISALEKQSKIVESKIQIVDKNYLAWVESAKTIDCSSSDKLQQSESLRDKAHQKAWSSFTELIDYYNKNVRSLYPNKASSSSPILNTNTL